MRFSGVVAGAVVLLSFGGTAAQAASCVTTYAMDFSITAQASPYPSATVTGSVCTDGTIGAISASNIASWDLTLSGSFNPSVSDFSISSANGGSINFVIQGTANPLSATATQLAWNYAIPTAGNYADLNFQGPPQPNLGRGYYYIGLYDNETINVAAPTYALSSVSGSYGSNLSGQVVIGQSVPEPASVALLGAGLMGMAVVRRRRTV